ncbi:MAG: hypothetical protein J7L79_01520 [Thaumarchaeota archaeon]|nr:hypothetical protein [Nitrososphaerota archaeon]
MGKVGASRMVEVVVSWPLGVAPEEAIKVYAEIGKVLHFLLPCSFELVFADPEGVRLKIGEEYLSEIRRLSKNLRYVEIEVVE